MPIPGGWELLVIVAIVLLLFGAKKLPEMARSMGQSARVFKGEMKGLRTDADVDVATTATTDEAPAQPVAIEPGAGVAASGGGSTVRAGVTGAAAPGR